MVDIVFEGLEKKEFVAGADVAVAAREIEIYELSFL
jgi:hypothetical protein